MKHTTFAILTAGLILSVGVISNPDVLLGPTYTDAKSSLRSVNLSGKYTLACDGITNVRMEEKDGALTWATSAGSHETFTEVPVDDEDSYSFDIGTNTGTYRRMFQSGDSFIFANIKKDEVSLYYTRDVNNFSIALWASKEL